MTSKTIFFFSFFYKTISINITDILQLSVDFPQQKKIITGFFREFPQQEKSYFFEIEKNESENTLLKQFSFFKNDDKYKLKVKFNIV